MNNGQLEKIESLFDSALEISPAERWAYLNQVCANDQPLKEAVLALLEAYEDAEDFIEASAVEDIFPQAHLAHNKFAEGDLLGHYKIKRELGRGGMGEVYLAEDVRLGRQIALKILPAHFTEDVEQIGRFEQEARAASSLNHPNIITIHDIVQEGDTHFIATEFINGQTLRERLTNGKLNLPDALDIALQIVKALMAAHAAGIIHRDIKPENIMVRDDGLVKVLDFGLAKPVDRKSSTNYSIATRVKDLQTNPEIFMGTVGYLSPEQVLRTAVDHRTDIFSLGVVMYEMIAGERPYKGNSPADICDAVLNHQPAPLQLDNRRFKSIVNRALEKDKEARYQTADEMLIELQQLAQEVSSTHHPSGQRYAVSSNPVRWKRRIAWAVSALVLLAGSIYVATVSSRKSGASTQPAVIAAAQPLSQSQALEYYPSFSPDGQAIVFERFDGTSDIYSQRISDRTTINLTKDFSKNASQPAFSPDGEHIAFSSWGIWTMSAKGGDYIKLSEEGFNPSWSPDSKEIVYATDRTIDSDRANIPGQLWIVNLETRDKRLLTEGDATQPNWSPHGQRVAYWNTQRGGQRDIWTMASTGGNAVAVTNDEFEDWGPVWSPDGKFLYFISNRGGSMNLWRIAIEEETGKVLGRPEPVTTPAVFCWHICFSRDGKHIAYVQVSKKGNINRLTFDPVNEKVLGEAVSITQGSNFATEPVVLSDGQSLVYNSIGDKQEDLFLLNLSNSNKETANVEHNQALRLTNDPFKDRGPQGSPDGQQIAFYSDRSGDYQIWVVNKDGSGLKQLTYAKGGNVFCPVWSPDSARVAYCFSAAKVTNTFIVKTNQSWTEQAPQLLSQNNSLIKHFLPSSWSGDGLKLAGWQYWTEKGRAGVYVYSFASKSYERWTDFGTFPVWLSDSRRLLFFKDSKIYLIDEMSQKPKLIHEIDSIAWTDILGITLTKDDRQLYFCQVTTEADIWLAEIR
jgi:serine/threonine protein kinase